MTDLDALIAEQHEHQIIGRTERTHGLLDYACILDWTDLMHEECKDYTRAFDHIIDAILAKNHQAVWVDLCCGNGAALRCGKHALERRGIDPTRLRTFGYDLLPADHRVLEDCARRFPRTLPAQITDERYAPTHLREPIETARFPEQPHLVTAVNALMWVRDPLQAIANAAAQTRIGGILSMNRMHHLLYTSQRTGCVYDAPLFSTHVFPRWKIPGFSRIGENTHSSDTLTMRKIKHTDDYTFGMALRDPPAKRAGNGTGYSYLYSKRQLTA